MGQHCLVASSILACSGTVGPHPVSQVHPQRALLGSGPRRHGTKGNAESRSMAGSRLGPTAHTLIPLTRPAHPLPSSASPPGTYPLKLSQCQWHWPDPGGWRGRWDAGGIGGEGWVARFPGHPDNEKQGEQRSVHSPSHSAAQMKGRQSRWGLLTPYEAKPQSHTRACVKLPRTRDMSFQISKQ